MEFAVVTENKKDYLPLLLLGDEQEDMIDRYLDRGTLHTLTDGDVRCVAVVVPLKEGDCELKNIACAPGFLRRGYGRAMLAHLARYYSRHFSAMYVGTGDVPSSLGFYRSCGFTDSHRVKGFFTDNYDHPMVEDGVLLQDMVYLKKTLAKEEDNELL